MSNKQLEDLVDLMFDTDMEELMKEKSTLEYIHKLQQENKQLKEKIDRALKKLKSSVNHFKTQRENNAVTFTIKILGDKE